MTACNWSSLGCTLRIAQDLELSRNMIASLRQALRLSGRCAAQSICPDSAYCTIAAAGLLARMDRGTKGEWPRDQ